MNGLAVVMTAWRRPYYLEPVLESWRKAAQRLKPDRFVISIGATDRYAGQLDVIEKASSRFPVRLEVLEQLPLGAHHAIGTAGNYLFSDPDVQFVVFGEEDVVVSDDVLCYMQWAREAFGRVPRVLTACAHNRAGQSWDAHEPARDADADQQVVRLLPYFNPWCWGTWRDRWEKVLVPSWCWQAGPFADGYDWRIYGQHMERGYLSAVPDASRSQNIGESEGLYTTPETWAFSQVQSFREKRYGVEYKLAGGEEWSRPA